MKYIVMAVVVFSVLLSVYDLCKEVCVDQLLSADNFFLIRLRNKVLIRQRPEEQFNS